ncbi:hypothetical protein LELG_00583 [Lodderomyces elongisporus NRRL YB-4239]|uniref:GATA-type domain-containing protein n=1 Tax=Lodderomyces elongisporus (strain ATCC 11503 / CBS 2605 / JCM 1781 / NBRC 1676 / NRRL YB-4239) TaxID=379508 RepID=A5DT97_LODEL|nr:hypothetical protein LELG_00583 [Lodderomyces elongisporus NRRL YB-4239]
MNKRVYHEAGPVPRLPSFQQLNETIKDTDPNTELVGEGFGGATAAAVSKTLAAATKTTTSSSLESSAAEAEAEAEAAEATAVAATAAKNILQYSSAFKNLALYQESQAIGNPNKIARTLTVGGSNPYSSGLGPDYSYGSNMLYTRHESYPNQYYNFASDVVRHTPDSKTPDSIEEMKLNSRPDNDELMHLSYVEDLSYVDDVILFLTDLQQKCSGGSSSYYTALEYKAMDTFSRIRNSVDIEDILVKMKKTTLLLKQFKATKMKLGGDLDDTTTTNAAPFITKRDKSPLLQTHKEKSQKRQKREQISVPLPTGPRILPFELNNHHLIDNYQHHQHQHHHHQNNSNSNSSNNNNNNCNSFDTASASAHDHSYARIVSHGNEQHTVQNTAQHYRINNNLNPELISKPDVVCQHCSSHETPEWRRGPEGSRTLCNACGLFYSKLIKKYGSREADRVMLERKQTGTVNDRRIF